jgi:hypothetical protein
MNQWDKLLAVTACTQAIHRFYVDLDAGNLDAVASAMHPHGVWHRQGKALLGVEGVRDALADRPLGRHTAHLVQNLVVDVQDTESAVATFLTLVYRHEAALPISGPAPLPPPLSISAHTDTLICDPDGIWRFAEKTSERRFAGA